MVERIVAMVKFNTQASRNGNSVEVDGNELTLEQATELRNSLDGCLMDVDATPQMEVARMQSAIEALARDLYRVFCESKPAEREVWEDFDGLTADLQQAWAHLASWHYSIVEQLKGEKRIPVKTETSAATIFCRFSQQPEPITKKWTPPDYFAAYVKPFMDWVIAGMPPQDIKVGEK
jgi:hypothetical protein